tara:strand:- start:7351 stop:8448 length:1098 start_codon:yes stop_codon:yes gene_type:complete
MNVDSALTIEELVNSNAHKSIREDADNNVKHKYCNRCWVIEDGGGHSYRQDWNNSFLDNGRKEPLRTVKIEYLEMTLGNKCNIQCRMCNPWSSNLWAEDIVKNPELNQWNAVVEGHNFEWYNTPAFDTLLESVIPTIKHINMLGGEPLFNPKYYEILQRIVDSGRASEVSLQFNTNLLALQDKNFDLWKEFKWVNANISCDGVENVNEYVRYPGKWSKFTRNLARIIQWQKDLGGHDKLILQIHSTMSSLTWLNLGELFKWCQVQELKYTMPFVIQVNQPHYLDCVHMPDEVKQLGYERAIEGIGSIDDWQTTNIYSLLDHVINTPGNPAQWDKMIRETNKLDRVRKSSILDIIPEYRKFWTDAT